MRKNIGLLVLAGAMGLAALSGCGPSPSAGPYQPGTSSPPSSSAGSSAASATVLKTASGSLGTIVVDGKGMTVYLFDKDTANSGKSACNAGCSATWPAVKATSSTPTVAGVTGKVGVITRDDGTMQATINGLPVYTYAKDLAAGDVKGQGVGGIWWPVSPDGDKVTGATSGY
jgi:predicted lipoprotein with Yx(FWY)xxD motif